MYGHPLRSLPLAHNQRHAAHNRWSARCACAVCGGPARRLVASSAAKALERSQPLSNDASTEVGGADSRARDRGTGARLPPGTQRQIRSTSRMPCFQALLAAFCGQALCPMPYMAADNTQQQRAGRTSESARSAAKHQRGRASGSSPKTVSAEVGVVSTTSWTIVTACGAGLDLQPKRPRGGSTIEWYN